MLTVVPQVEDECWERACHCWVAAHQANADGFKQCRCSAWRLHACGWYDPRETRHSTALTLGVELGVLADPYGIGELTSWIAPVGDDGAPPARKGRGDDDDALYSCSDGTGDVSLAGDDDL